MNEQPEVTYDLDGNPIEVTVSVEDHTETFMDVLDNTPIETSFDVESMFEKQVSVEDFTYDDAVVSIESFSESSALLNDLYFTISKEGVSQEDMRTLKIIQGRLQANGLPTDGLGLEEYDHYLFTQDRSSVSLTVAQESFFSTMVRTVKEWIKKVVEFIGRMIEWVVKTFLGEAKYKRKFDKAVKRYELAKDVRIKAEVLANTQARTSKPMLDYALSLLSNERLAGNRITLAAFGDRTQTNAVEGLSKDALDTAKTIVRELDVLKRDIESNEKNLKFNDRSNLSMAIIAELADDLTVDKGRADYLKAHIKNDVFTKNLPKETTTVTPFEAHVAEYGQMRNKFKSIKKVENKERLSEIIEHMNKTMRAITDLGRILKVVKDINEVKLQVIGLFLNYENHYANMIMRIVRDEIKDEGKRERLNKMFADARENLHKFE